jgi:hypothetical protein
MLSVYDFMLKQNINFKVSFFKFKKKTFILTYDLALVRSGLVGVQNESFG